MSIRDTPSLLWEILTEEIDPKLYALAGIATLVAVVVAARRGFWNA